MKPCIETWLKTQFGDDATLIGEIYAEYRQTLGRLLDELAAVLASGDAASRDRVLHTIKGSAATVGDAELSELAQASRSLTEGDRLREVERTMRTMLENL